MNAFEGKDEKTPLTDAEVKRSVGIALMSGMEQAWEDMCHFAKDLARELDELERENAELRERLKDHVVHLEPGAPGTAGYSGTIIVAGTDLPKATDK